MTDFEPCFKTWALGRARPELLLIIWLLDFHKKTLFHTKSSKTWLCFLYFFIACLVSSCWFYSYINVCCYQGYIEIKNISFSLNLYIYCCIVVKSGRTKINYLNKQLRLALVIKIFMVFLFIFATGKEWQILMTIIPLSSLSRSPFYLTQDFCLGGKWPGVQTWVHRVSTYTDMRAKFYFIKCWVFIKTIMGFQPNSE